MAHPTGTGRRAQLLRLRQPCLEPETGPGEVHGTLPFPGLPAINVTVRGPVRTCNGCGRSSCSRPTISAPTCRQHSAPPSVRQAFEPPSASKEHSRDPCLNSHSAPLGRRSAGLLAGIPTTEGEGITVYRPFPSAAVREIDPFLLLDRLGPVPIAPGAGTGVPPHPHAGFEVVSYVLQGGLEHRDSGGHHGRLGPGDVQWMSAGSGIVHSEMPTADLRAKGGTLEAIQLWINLPARDKQMVPRYGDLSGATIPSAKSSDRLASVRVIAGEALGARATLPLRSPITYLHWTLEPGATVAQPLPDGTVALVYVLTGEARVGSDARTAARDTLVRFEGTVGHVNLSVLRDGTRTELILLAGPPTGEPVARSGPFVMNTMAEIRAVVAKYRAGGLGEIPVG